MAITSPAPSAVPTLGFVPAPSAATVAETCTGCQVVISAATSSIGVTTTTAIGGPVVTVSVTPFAIFSAFRVESVIAPPATNGAAVLGCAITTQYVSELPFPSSYQIPNPSPPGWDLSIASAFIRTAGVPVCGPSPAIVLEGATEDVLNGSPQITSAKTTPTSSASTRPTGADEATATPQPASSAATFVEASIGIGVSIGIALIAVLSLLLMRRHRRRRLGVNKAASESTSTDAESGFTSKAELPAKQLPEVDGTDFTREAASEPCYELDAGEVAKEKWSETWLGKRVEADASQESLFLEARKRGMFIRHTEIERFSEVSELKIVSPMTDRRMTVRCSAVSVDNVVSPTSERNDGLPESRDGLRGSDQSETSDDTLVERRNDDGEGSERTNSVASRCESGLWGEKNVEIVQEEAVESPTNEDDDEESTRDLDSS